MLPEGRSGQIQLHRRAPLAQLAGQHERLCLRLVTTAHHIDLRGLKNRHGRGLGQQEHQSLHPQRPTHSSRRRAAQLLHQAVVAPATAHGGLCSELAGGDLKGGVAVVVEAAHQPGIELEGNAQSL